MTDVVPIVPLNHDGLLQSQLLDLVSYKKTADFIRHYPIDKACGLDSIHTVLLRALSSSKLFLRLTKLFQLCIQKGETPRRWNSSVMYLLPKKSEPPIDSRSVRPLSILPMFRRIFEGLVLPIFTDDASAWTHLHPTQAGFRKGYSTLTQALICHHALATKSISHVVFLDFKSAYDVTTETHVMDALEKRKMPPLLRRLVQSLMFKNASFQLVVNGDLSKPILRNCGLPQGSSLSPVVFDMFIDPLNHQLNRATTNTIPSCLFFADDGALLCRSLSHAKSLLRVAEKWALDNGMIYNVDKCGVIHTNPPSNDESRALHLNGNEIPAVDIYKYLGFPMTASGIDFTMHIISQTESTKSFLKFVQIQCNEWTPYTRYIVYNTFLRPKLEYGAPVGYAFQNFIGGKELVMKVQEVQNEAFAWVLNTNERNWRVTEGILGALPIVERFKHLRCGFQLHLANSNPQNPIVHLLAVVSHRQFISSFKSDKLYSEFSSSYQGSSNDSKAQKSALHLFLLNCRWGYILKNSGVLVKYIPKTARTDSLMDITLKSPAHLQRRLVSWRRGGLFLNSTCKCGAQWNRGHVEHMPAIVLDAEAEKEFLEEKKRYEGLKLPNFNRLDYLLNVRAWDAASEVIEVWGNQVKKIEEVE